MVEREEVSALMDGEIGDEDLGARLQRVAASEDLAGTWQAYHVIGDVLRGEGALPGRFSNRVSTALAAEPTVLAPQPRRSFAMRRTLRLALPIAASVAGVAAVVWLAVSGSLPGSVGDQQAWQSEPTEEAVAKEAPLLPAPTAQRSDPQVNEYLLVHQEYSPTSAMQGVGSYIRSVSAQNR